MNGDGKIHDITELFGDDDPTHADGFSKLATLDDNVDGVIDAIDAAFADLRIWRDADNDELAALAEHGIASFSLATTEDASTFTRADGTTGLAQDAVLESDQMRTV